MRAVESKPVSKPCEFLNVPATLRGWSKGCNYGNWNGLCLAVVTGGHILLFVSRCRYRKDEIVGYAASRGILMLSAFVTDDR